MSSSKSNNTASAVSKGVIAWVTYTHGLNTSATKWPVAKYKKHGLPIKWGERFNDIYEISGQDRNGDTILYNIIGLYAGPDKDRFVINRLLFKWLAAEDEILGVYDDEEKNGKSVIIYVASADEIDADWRAGNIEEETFQTPVLLLPHDDDYWVKSDWIRKKNDLRRKTKGNEDRTHKSRIHNRSGERKIYYPTSWEAFWRSKEIPESAMSRNPTSDREQRDIDKVAKFLGAKDMWITKRARWKGKKIKVVVIY